MKLQFLYKTTISLWNYKFYVKLLFLCETTISMWATISLWNYNFYFFHLDHPWMVSFILFDPITIFSNFTVLISLSNLNKFILFFIHLKSIIQIYSSSLSRTAFCFDNPTSFEIIHWFLFWKAEQRFESSTSRSTFPNHLAH